MTTATDSDILKSAAERWRTGNYSDALIVRLQRNLDATTLADAYCAANPADDAEPVTEEFLMQSGFVPAPTKRFGLLKAGVLIVHPPCGDLATFTAIYDGGTSRTIPVKSGPITRGEIRRLCVALGFPA